ncbi:hypothetical protein AVEN_97949-1 [Araneus ventricosus]|uniref:Uncharacterized protein n=1 Tax=Araneus ventricosus TaxID=182803 RepID=A0A4Y2X3Y6_ARAVE|nr:hypothetical protein AVEN_97949-1 [Araneus ventricosus]
MHDMVGAAVSGRHVVEDILQGGEIVRYYHAREVSALQMCPTGLFGEYYGTKITPLPCTESASLDTCRFYYAPTCRVGNVGFAQRAAQPDSNT